MKRYYVWKKNADAGQTIGNKQIVQPMTRELWDKWVKQLMPQYMEGLYMSLVHVEHVGEWRLSKVGTQLDCMPARVCFRKGWVIAVKSFKSEGVKQHRNTAD